MRDLHYLFSVAEKLLDCAHNCICNAEKGNSKAIRAVATFNIHKALEVLLVVAYSTKGLGHCPTNHDLHTMLNGYTRDNYELSPTMVDDLFLVTTLTPEWFRNGNYTGNTEVDDDKLIKAFVSVVRFMDLLRETNYYSKQDKTSNEVKPLILGD